MFSASVSLFFFTVDSGCLQNKHRQLCNTWTVRKQKSMRHRVIIHRQFNNNNGLLCLLYYHEILFNSQRQCRNFIHNLPLTLNTHTHTHRRPAVRSVCEHLHNIRSYLWVCTAPRWQSWRRTCAAPRRWASQKHQWEAGTHEASGIFPAHWQNTEAALDLCPGQSICRGDTETEVRTREGRTAGSANVVIILFYALIIFFMAPNFFLIPLFTPVYAR